MDARAIELNFGNHEAVISLIPKIAFREGFGDVLADGSREAAVKTGKGSYKYAMHIKGLELPGYDPRGVKTHGFSFATSYTRAVSCDSATMCNFILDAFFPGGSAKNTADLVNAATGLDFTVLEIEKMGVLI